jgi:hypothetical protein
MNGKPISQQHDVTIDDEPCRVMVVKTGKVTWKAYGSFRGRHIEKSNSSASSALSAWKKIAEYQSKE